jgi:hypothetical protein
MARLFRIVLEKDFPDSPLRGKDFNFHCLQPGLPQVASHTPSHQFVDAFVDLLDLPIAQFSLVVAHCWD